LRHALRQAPLRGARLRGAEIHFSGKGLARRIAQLPGQVSARTVPEWQLRVPQMPGFLKTAALKTNPGAGLYRYARNRVQQQVTIDGSIFKARARSQLCRQNGKNGARFARPSYDGRRFAGRASAG